MSIFTKWSLRYRWVTLIIAVVVLGLGVYGAIALQQELLPNIEFPVATVLTRLPGASTDETLTLVTLPVEEAARESGNVLNLQSISSPGVSAVVVMADFGQSGDKLAAELEDTLGAITLPPGAEAEVLQMNIQDLPVIEVSASGDISLAELQPIVLEQIVPRLEALEGVSAVEVVGGLEETAPAPATTAGQGLALPASWTAASALRGVALNTTGDVTPEIIQGMAQMAPQMLDELTPEMLLEFAPAAIQALPEAFVAGLEADLQAGLAERAAQTGVSAVALPDSWQAAGVAQGMPLNTTADLTPQTIQGIAQFAPQMLEELTPEMLLAMSPDALAALPATYLESLDTDLRAQLGATAEEVVAAPPATIINRTNGNPSLGISVNKTRDANTVAVVHRVEETLEDLQGELSGVRFDTVFEQAGFIEESISGVVREGVLGALFAIIVILVFLSFSVRSTLVSAVSIPLSVFAAFALLNWQGLTLNMMTLGGMTVAIGRVIDDSIVVLENIYRHIQRGEDRKEAVLVGTGDVNAAILASTATTVAVFLPLGLIGGIISQFFLPFALTVVFALAASYFVAITVVPVLAYMFIRKEHLPEEKESWLQRLYTPALKWALRHRALTLIGAALLLVVSMSLMRFIPMTFIPDVGEATVQINLDMPPGTDMATTDRVAMEIEAALADLGCVCTVQTVVGGGGGGMAAMMGSGTVNPTQANMSLAIEEGADLEASVTRIRKVAEGIAGADNVTVSSAGSLFGGAFGGVDLVVTADRYEDLAAVNDPIVAALEEVDGLVNVGSDLGAALGANGMITRINGKQAISFSAEVEGEDTMRVGAQARQAVENLPNLPAGVEISEGFQSQQQTAGFRDMGTAMLIAIGVVYLILALTFRSLIQPFTILFSLPLAVIGALWALFLTGRVLSISSLIGMLMLIGIVVTNAIVLIDRVQRNRKLRGMGTYEALVEAGRTRLRPILMTAIAAMLALVPLALGLTEGAIIAAELATVVIGGLFSSTLLTLLVVPTVYSLLDNLGAWFAAKTTRRRQLAEPAAGD
jgi:HAE1 family hydrophobic/amphiphilic exporter-1